jgi:hypothetical protein
VPESGEQAWNEYRDRELAAARPYLASLGIILDDEQVHIKGERFLGNAKKLVLTGTANEPMGRVFIKLSSDPAGCRELEREHMARGVLQNPMFSSRGLYLPIERVFQHVGSYTISVTSEIPNDKDFVHRPIGEQIEFAKQLMEVQESVRLDSGSVDHFTKRTLGVADERHILTAFASFRDTALKYPQANLVSAKEMELTGVFLETNVQTLALYSGVLAHTDCAPQNFRLHNDRIYFFDIASFRFTNQYDSWARFINAMITMSPAVERALVALVNARGPDEALCLRLMRAFKCGFYIAFFSRATAIASGPLKTLCAARVGFWTRVLEAILADAPLSERTVLEFLELRSQLRSADEVQRRKELQ